MPALLSPTALLERLERLRRRLARAEEAHRRGQAETPAALRRAVKAAEAAASHANKQTTRGMPFKRPNSSYWRIRLDLPGYGKTGQLSARVRSKAVARQMEELVRRIGEWGLTDPDWYTLLDGLRAGSLTLPDLLKAKNENRLDELRGMMRDPLVSEAIEEYRRAGVSYEIDNGLSVLEEMTRREFGPRTHMGVFRTSKNISLILARAKREGGRDRSTMEFGRPVSHNYVRRSAMLACSKLLTFHWGSAERNRIFSDVGFSHEDDTRDVWLSAEEIDRLIDACETWFRPFVLTAVSTGADRAPLLRLRVRDVEIAFRKDLGLYAGRIYLRDSKTNSRPRTVTIVGPVCEVLRPLLVGKEPDDKVFEAWHDETAGRRVSLTADRVRRAFEQAREKAGFTREAGYVDDLRLKDLRRTWAVNADEAGLNLGQIKHGMGHRREVTSVKYTNRQVKLELEPALRVARQMGFLEGSDSAAKKAI